MFPQSRLGDSDVGLLDLIGRGVQEVSWGVGMREEKKATKGHECVYLVGTWSSTLLRGEEAGEFFYKLLFLTI